MAPSNFLSSSWKSPGPSTGAPKERFNLSWWRVTSSHCKQRGEREQKSALFVHLGGGRARRPPRQHKTNWRPAERACRRATTGRRMIDCGAAASCWRPRAFGARAKSSEPRTSCADCFISPWAGRRRRATQPLALLFAWAPSDRRLQQALAQLPIGARRKLAATVFSSRRARQAARPYQCAVWGQPRSAP